MLKSLTWRMDNYPNYAQASFTTGRGSALQASVAERPIALPPATTRERAMGHVQPFHSERSGSIDPLSALRRLLADLESGKTAIVSNGVDATPTYVLVLKAQIEHLETLLIE